VLVNKYEHDGFMRSMTTRVIRSVAANYSNGRISFLIDLPPRIPGILAAST
jgi:hypothetical protein